MAFARRACDFLWCCFVSSEDEDDNVELVAEASVPPVVDGSAMPSTGVVCDDNPDRFELDAIMQMFNKKLNLELNAIKEEHEKQLVAIVETHQRELAAFRAEYEEHIAIIAQAQRSEFDNLNERVAAVDERCDRFDSRINSLREQQQYEEPIFPTYSVNYVHEEQEVMPQFDP